MLDLCLTDRVELSEHDFDRFIHDEWEWKDDFLRTLELKRTRFAVREQE